MRSEIGKEILKWAVTGLIGGLCALGVMVLEYTQIIAPSVNKLQVDTNKLTGDIAILDQRVQDQKGKLDKYSPEIERAERLFHSVDYKRTVDFLTAVRDNEKATELIAFMGKLKELDGGNLSGFWQEKNKPADTATRIFILQDGMFVSIAFLHRDGTMPGTEGVRNTGYVRIGKIEDDKTIAVYYGQYPPDKIGGPVGKWTIDTIDTRTELTEPNGGAVFVRKNLSNLKK